MAQRKLKKQNKINKINKINLLKEENKSALKTNREKSFKALKSPDLGKEAVQKNKKMPDSKATQPEKLNISAPKQADEISESRKISGLTVPAAVVQAAQKTRKKINIPNMLTLFRIWAIPAIVFTFFFDTPMAAWIGVFLFILAAISDYMDGYLARHLNQLSRFGRVLDPIADKLLIGSILLMLAFTARLGDYGIIPAVIILCREILVSGLREFLAEIKVGCPVTRLAKWKTACQMTALPMLMVCEPGFSGFLSDVFYYVGHLALWGAALLTVMTGYDYWKSGRKYMDE